MAKGKYAIKSVLNHVNQIQDYQLRDILKEYLYHIDVKAKNEKYYYVLRPRACDIVQNIHMATTAKHLDWEWFCTLYSRISTIPNCPPAFKDFFIFVFQNGYFQGETVVINEFIPYFKNIRQSDLLIGPIFKKKISPLHFAIVEDPRNGRHTLIEFDFANPEIRQLLIDFLNTNLHMNKRNGRYFFSEFKKSLGHINVNTITDFGINTLEAQLKYFSHLSSTLSYDDKQLVTNVRYFYAHLLDLPEGKGIITIKDGVDSYLLRSKKFEEHYKQGFRLVLYNPFEPRPQSDKWLVRPNGLEKSTARMHEYNHVMVDFSNIVDEKMKEALKEWFWNSEQGLENRAKSAYYTADYINFRTKILSQHHLNAFLPSDPQLAISAEEVFAYVTQLKQRNYTYMTYRAWTYGILRFLRYVDENKIYDVDPAAFQYLIVRNAEVSKNVADVTDEELIRLEAKFREKAKNSYLYKLFYAVFHLSLSTPMRPSEICNLDVNCLVKGSTKGTYAISSISKTSNGEPQIQQITGYTKRHIEQIKELTEKVRQSCNDNALKQYLFITNEKNNRYSVLNARHFSKYLTSICKELGIKEYSSNNLRKTYMTKAVEYALKKGVSQLELSSLTGHVNIDTTNNHYINQKIRDYLEATHGITIGNVDLNGQILASLEEPLNSNYIVNNGCGYCSRPSCNVYTGIDCVMCKGFITTIDNIPYFERKVDILSEEIYTAPTEHDRENIYTIKRLYVAYLERLYCLKEEVGA